MAIFRTIFPAVALPLLAGCVTYPYETAFNACDAEAGACYEYCEEFADDAEEYSSCHQNCEEGANLCFADAYDQNRYAQGATTYYAPSPWYGRYGYWYPQTGYIFSFDYFGGRRGYYGRNYGPRYGDPYYGRRGGGRNRNRPPSDSDDAYSGPAPRRPNRGDADTAPLNDGRNGAPTPPPRRADPPPPRRADPPPPRRTPRNENDVDREER